MRTSPFMHIPGIPGTPIPTNVQLLKDGRLAHGGVDVNDPRLSNLSDIGTLQCSLLCMLFAHIWISKLRFILEIRYG